MSLLYSPNLKYPDGEMRKNQMETMDSSYKMHLQQQQHTHHLNTGVSRYCSAPSSVLESLVVVNGGASNGVVNVEDYQFIRSSSPEMESLFAKYMGHGSDNSGGKKVLKQEDLEQGVEAIARQQNGSYGGYGSDSIHKTFPVQYMEGNESSTGMNSSFGCGMNSMELQNLRKCKLGTANGSNLVRQSSSPAGFLSNMGVENGFAVMKDSGNLRTPNGTNGEVSRISGHINFSSGLPSSCRPSIVADVGNESFGASNDRSHYMPTSWNETSFVGLKRPREEHGNMFSSLNTLETENEDSRNRITTTGLTHQLSMPNTSNEMSIIDKYLQFQGSVPCKVRAKRGFATHPRSIAERVRRTRISERMRKLQELFPNMDKQANTADMLDLAVKHIKDLQKQVKTLTDKKAKCTCKEKQPCPIPLA